MQISPQEQHPVCVSGMGSVCAAGSNLATFLCADTVLSPPSILYKDIMPYPFFAAPDEAFAGKRHFSSRDTLSIALFAAEKALQQANISASSAEKGSISTEKRKNIGVVLGTTSGSALHFWEGYNAGRSGVSNTEEITDVEEYFTSNLALSIAQKYAFLGPALTIANACTSGADAIGLGMDMILHGQCDMVLCGGADALSLVPHTGFGRLMIYSKELCRPFDGQRTGLNLGEAAGILLLEKTEHAKARGITPLGYIAGYGGHADAHHFTAPHPEARGLHMSIQAAFKQAQIGFDDLAFVNAHGTATPENDRIEGAYFRTHLPNTPVWGSKSITGHTLGAAGALEAIFSLLALQQKYVPPTKGFENIDPEIGLMPTTTRTDIDKNYALSTSLGFGGTNAALILKGV